MQTVAGPVRAPKAVDGPSGADRAETRALEALEQARRLNSAFRPAAAERAARRGMALLGVHNLEAELAAYDGPYVHTVGRLAITCAKSAAELSGLAHGTALLDAVRALADRRGDAVLSALAESQRALVYLRAGDGARALDIYQAAEALLRTLPARERAIVLLNRGALRLERLELEAARQDFRASVALGHEGGATNTAMALHNLGYAEFLAGNLPAALAAMDDAGRAFDPPQGVTFLDRARVLLEAGLHREADEALATAASIFARGRSGRDLGEAEVERARVALVAGDIGGARRLAGSARVRFRRQGNDAWRRVAELVLLQGDVQAGRPGARLLGPALRLHDEFSSLGMRPQAAAAALIAAEAALRAGDLPLARSLASAPAARRDPVTLRLQRRVVRAGLHDATGAIAAARREVRTGLAELALHQARFGSIDAQTAAAVHGRRLSELGIAFALRSGAPAEVLLASERARAVSNRLTRVRPPADPTAAALFTQLRQVSEALHSAQAGETSRVLLSRRRELEGEIAARGWTLGGSRTARDIATVADLRETARVEDVEVVSFVTSGDRLAAVVAGTSLRLVDLGPAAPVVEHVRRARADLDALARPGLPEALAEAVRTSLQRSLRSLDGAVVRPLAVSDRRLVIVSTGVLGQLPWGALPALRGIPVVVAPSVTGWVGAARSSRRRSREIVALAGPGLPSATRELTGVRRAWPAGRPVDVRSGVSADRRSFVDALARAAVVHIAAHGNHQTENALFSSLRMSDGAVFAYELDRTRRPAEHVILSACELGLATVRPGDEALGLTSVLLRLGTRSVVAGVARVNDETTATVMTRYHRELARGHDSAAALATATTSIDMAEAIAPFVCFGATWRAQA